MGVPFRFPLYVFFFFVGAVLYLFGAFVLGVVGAVLTLPVLYYTGYGLLPPRLAPAARGAGRSAAARAHLGFGGLFAVCAVLATQFTGRVVPPLVRYRFARISPRLEALPKLALATGIVLVLWVGYLAHARDGFDGDSGGEQRSALVASIVAAVVFCLSALSFAVLSTATLYV